MWCSQFPLWARRPWWRQIQFLSTPEIASFVFLSLIVRCETKALNGDNPLTFSVKFLPRLFLSCHKGVVLGPIAFGRRHIKKIQHYNKQLPGERRIETEANTRKRDGGSRETSLWLCSCYIEQWKELGKLCPFNVVWDKSKGSELRHYQRLEIEVVARIAKDYNLLS